MGWLGVERRKRAARRSLVDHATEAVASTMSSRRNYGNKSPHRRFHFATDAGRRKLIPTS
jgi:hypothetical protein